MTKNVYVACSWADFMMDRDILLATQAHDRLISLCSSLHPIFSRLFFTPEIPIPSRTRKMQRINDADHIATYSDSTYPVGPDTSGEITYVHVPPLGPLSSACDLFVGFDTPPNVCALPTSHRHGAILPSGRRIHLVLPLSSGPKVEPRRNRRNRQRPRQTTTGLSLGSIRAIAVHPALAADDDHDDHAAEHATLAAARRAALRRAGHAHRKAAAGRETLARVVVLALAFVVARIVVIVVVVVFALASVFVPTVGDTADVRAAVWWWRSAGHRRACGSGDLGTDRGVPHHAQEGGW